MSPVLQVSSAFYLGFATKRIEGLLSFLMSLPATAQSVACIMLPASYGLSGTRLQSTAHVAYLNKPKIGNSIAIIRT